VNPTRTLKPAQVVTPPVEEPIDAAYVRAHMHLDDDADDAMLELLITAARELVEEAIDGALVTTTFDASFDQVTGAALELPRGRVVQSVTSVTTYSAAGTGTLAAGASYFTDTTGLFGRVIAVDGYSWPATSTLRSANGLVVRYVAGFGTADDVPEALKRAVAETVRAIYDEDADAMNGTLPPLAAMLARPWIPLEVG